MTDTERKRRPNLMAGVMETEAEVRAFFMGMWFGQFDIARDQPEDRPMREYVRQHAHDHATEFDENPEDADTVVKRALYHGSKLFEAYLAERERRGPVGVPDGPPLIDWATTELIRVDIPSDEEDQEDAV